MKGALVGAVVAALAGVLGGAALKADPREGAVGGAQQLGLQSPNRAPNAFDAWYPQEGPPPPPIEAVASGDSGPDMAAVEREIGRLLDFASSPLPVLAPERPVEPPYLPSQGGDILRPTQSAAALPPPDFSERAPPPGSDSAPGLEPLPPAG